MMTLCWVGLFHFLIHVQHESSRQLLQYISDSIWLEHVQEMKTWLYLVPTFG